MPTIAPCLIHSRDPSGGLVRPGVPLLDDYLEFLSGRSRLNTVLSVVYDQSMSWWVAELKRTA